MKDAPYTDPAQDLRGYRNALGSFGTGVAVITAELEGELLGMTVNSFSSVSLLPPLVLWSIGDRATNFEAFCSVEQFAIHILSVNQRAVSDQFAQSSGDKYAGLEWGYDRAGVPRLPGCVTRFLCKRFAVYPGGDHRIIIGQVEGFETNEAEPLMFLKGQYIDLARRQAS